MAIDFSQVKKIVIPEGSVKKITDSQGNILWSLYELYEGYYLTSHSYNYNTNYIDLGIKWNNNWKLECKFYKPTTISQWGRLLGTGYDTSSEVYVNYNADTNGDFVINYGNTYVNSLSNANAINTEYNFAFGNRGTKCACYFLKPGGDWTAFGTTWSPSNTNSTHNLRLFSNEQGDRDGIFGISKIQINGPSDLWSESGALMLLVPARRKSDGCLGMYDKNNDIFYPCITSGTGYFTITDVNGNVIVSELRRLEYIHFNGNDYIDTGYTPWNDFGFYLDIQWDANQVNQYNGHGKIISNNRAFIGVHDSGKILFGSGAESPTISNSDPYTRHTYQVNTSSGSNGKFYIDGTQVWSGNSNYVSSNLYTMFIGAVNRNSSEYSYCKARIYNVRFINNVSTSSVITRNWVPVQRKSDGAIGFLKIKVEDSTPDFVQSVNGLLEAGPVIDEYWDLTA